MKILFLNIYQGIVFRGAENFAAEVSTRLSTNHQVEVFSAKGKIGEAGARLQTSYSFLGKVLYKFYFDSHSLRVLFWTLAVLPKILRGNYDWVIPVDGGWQVLLLKTLQKIGRYKILISGQAGIGRDDLRNLKLKPDVFVALTDRAEEWAREVSGKDRNKVKVVHLPNGVDLERFNPKVKPIKIDLEKPIIICVAGLNPYKQVDFTIKAVANVGNGSLLVLGDGPEREKIEKLGQELLGPKRFLRTTVFYEEMPSYYKASNLFTLVSASSEAFGSAYVEAMACGLPVVATDDRNRREIIGDAGLFVDPVDLLCYSEAIEKALKTDWKDKPRRQAEKFSWDKIAAQYAQIMVE